MAIPTYISPTELAARTDHASVAGLAPAKLNLLILRATGLMKDYGDLPDPSDLDDTQPLYSYVDDWTTPGSPVTVDWTLRDLFTEEMKTVVTLIVERIFYATRTVGADAAGLVSEDIGGYSYSRASSGGNTGTPVEGTIISDEVRRILARWVLVDAFDVPLIQRTDVFLQTPWFDDLNPLRGIVVEEILQDYVLRASNRTGLGF